MAFVFRRIDGIYGVIIIPDIGLTVGTMLNWTLQRREKTTPELGDWDFRAAFSYLNQHAWESDAWEKQIILTLGHRRTGTQYRLERTSGRTVLEGSNLLIEGVKLHYVHDESTDG